MVSLKRIGFFWGEEKITIVEFEKNIPLRIISSPLASKANALSPFSSNLNEEIQITAILQKMLKDNRITGASFYVSMPMKEFILRSFILPLFKKDEIENAIKFEAKKYMPFDIQDLSLVFHTIPITEGDQKRLLAILFAARKEVLAYYGRIFKQVNAEVSYCEPYMVSLTKALLFKKEIKPTDRLAFLILDKNLVRICFVDRGIPQFIRDFPINLSSQTDEPGDSVETLRL
jgi:Tfp pilus assembly PilM family ATPase